MKVSKHPRYCNHTLIHKQKKKKTDKVHDIKSLYPFVKLTVPHILNGVRKKKETLRSAESSTGVPRPRWPSPPVIFRPE